MRNLDAVKGEATAFGLLKDLLLSMRPHHWLKNLLIFLPPLVFLPWDFALYFRVGAEPILISFCCAASGVYLFNDCVDFDRDKEHASKRWRPIAAGKIGLRLAAALSATLASLGLIIGGSTNSRVGYILLSYIVLNLFYTLIVKRVFVADIILLAVFYLIRIIVGGEIYNIRMDINIFLSLTFVFIWLAGLKRSFERLYMGYTTKDVRILDIVTLSSLALAFLFLGTYFVSGADKIFGITPGFSLFLLAQFLSCILFHRSIQLNHGRGDFLVFFLKSNYSRIMMAVFLYAIWFFKRTIQ